MVKYVKGNLLDSDCNYICHQVNCQGVMGSGVAKAIKEEWPEVYRSYRAHVLIHRSDILDDGILGTNLLVPIKEGHQAVINMFAQNVYGYDGVRYTSYDAFYKCLEDIRDNVSSHCSIAFPYKIGSDRGGASWNVIYAMICDVLGDREVTIYKLEDCQ